MSEQPSVASIVEVDGLMARTLELDGLLCFHCPLLEDPRLARQTGLGECGVRYRDLAPVLSGPRSGIKAVVAGGTIAAYTVFGPPKVFRNSPDLPFELDEDALLVAALYALPEAREDSLDVDLLVAVMEFAREHGFDRVQALCRGNPDAGPEARAEIISAAGFEVTEAVDGIQLGTIGLSEWDAPGEA